MKDFAVRRLSAFDAKGVSALEAECFPSFWDAGAYARAMESQDFLCYGAFEGDALVGYIACQCVLDELEVLNVAVKESCRGRRIASSLLASALREAGEHHILSCFLEVRKSNVPALRLYGRAGFAAVGLRRGYYSQTGEDALVMRATLKGD